MTKPAEAQVFVGRVQASLRDDGEDQPGVRPLHPEHGHRRVAPARHHREQRARRGRHRAVQGQAGRPEHRRGRGRASRHGPIRSSSSSATPSGWTSSTAPAGRIASPPDLLPDIAAFAPLGPRCSASTPARTASRSGVVRRFAAGLTELAEALHAGWQPPGGRDRRASTSSSPGASGSHQLTRVSGAVAAPLRARPARLAPLEAIARRPRPTLADRSVAVRRCAGDSLLPLLHRRLADAEPPLVRPGAVRRATSGSSAAGGCCR